MMVPSKVETLFDFSNSSYVLVNAWQFLAMVDNALHYLVMLDHFLCCAWHGVTYSRSWNEFTFILVIHAFLVSDIINDSTPPRI